MAGDRCKYYPSCSEYAAQAIQRFGILRGLVLAGWRLLRCNPWSLGGVDLVEDQRLFKSRATADERLSMLISANIFQPLIDVFQSVLSFFHNSFGLRWGWSIVLLTMCVRAVLLPLTVKQFHSMQKMQALGPEMKALQAKYKEDKERQQQEMMQLLPGERGQPARLLPAAGGPAAGVHLAVLHAAHQPSGRYLPSDPARAQPWGSQHRPYGPVRSPSAVRASLVPVHPRLDRTRRPAWS